MKTNNAVKDYFENKAMTEKIQAKFAADVVMNSMNITIQSNGAIVTLTGKVSTQKIIDKAKTIVSNIKGVAEVIVHLEVLK
jgi:osmotically-inducible protein OsmY